MMARNPRSSWYRLDHGSLVLDARPIGLGGMGNPSFLARRQQHIDATASTLVRFQPAHEGDEAGLTIFQNDDYWYAIAIGMDGGRPVVQLRRRAGAAESASGAVVATAPLPGAAGEPIRLRIQAEGARYRFSYAASAGDWHDLGGDQDGTILSTNIAGGFVGAVFGPYARTAPEAEPLSPIRLNQIGFLPDGPKRALLPSDSASAAPLGAERPLGRVPGARRDHRHRRRPGVGRAPPSDRFQRLPAGRRQFPARRRDGAKPGVPDRRGRFARLPFDALNYFYQSRASIPIEARYAGGERWARPAGHAPDRATCISGPDERGDRWAPCAYTLDVSRGWYDAGDQGKYVVNGGIALWTLLDLYELGQVRGRPSSPTAAPPFPRPATA